MTVKNIETLAKKLGASIEGTVPDYSPGAFGMSALANLLRDRLGGRRFFPGTAGASPASPERSAERRQSSLLPAERPGLAAQSLENAGETPAVSGKARPAKSRLTT